MRLIDWFRKTTFEGKVKKEIGEFTSCERGKIQVQELELDKAGKSKFRFNLVHATALSYQSIPIVLDRSETKKFADALRESLEK